MDDPDVGSDALGNDVVVWSEEIGKSGDFDIFARMFNRSGQPTGEQFPVSSDPAGDQLHPSVDVNPQGDFAVVWEAEGDATNEGRVVVRFFLSAGDQAPLVAWPTCFPPAV